MPVRFLSPAEWARKNALEARWKAKREELQRQVSEGAASKEEARTLHALMTDRTDYDARVRDEMECTEAYAVAMAEDAREQDRLYREQLREGRITGPLSLSFVDPKEPKEEL